MDHATFVRPDLTTFCRLDELGLEAVGQRVEPDRAVIQCRVLEPDPWCRECGAEGVPRDTVIRRLAHEPFGHRPTTLMVRVRRYRCVTCRRTWRQDTSKAAAPRAKITRGGVGWALTGVVVDHLTVSRVGCRAGSVLAYRQRGGHRRGQAGADRRSGPVRRGHHHRGR